MAVEFWSYFFDVFLENMHKHEKWKSSFRIVKYSVSWGSPCSKKQATLRKNASFFFIDFSSIFRETSMKNRAKRVQIGLAHKNRQKSTLGPPFFSKKSIFGRFLGFLWVPGGLPGRPWSLPESSVFSLIFSFVWKRARTVPREAPGRPRGTPRVPFWVDFWLILYVKQCQKNVEKCYRNMDKTISKSRKQPNSD